VYIVGHTISHQRVSHTINMPTIFTIYILALTCRTYKEPGRQVSS